MLERYGHPEKWDYLSLTEYNALRQDDEPWPGEVHSCMTTSYALKVNTLKRDGGCLEWQTRQICCSTVYLSHLDTVTCHCSCKMLIWYDKCIKDTLWCQGELYSCYIHIWIYYSRHLCAVLANFHITICCLKTQLHIKCIWFMQTVSMLCWHNVPIGMVCHIIICLAVDALINTLLLYSIQICT